MNKKMEKSESCFPKIGAIKAFFYLALMNLGLFTTDVAEAQEQSREIRDIRVYCEEKMMEIWMGDDVFEIKVQLGYGCGKEEEGDRKVPLGAYQVESMISRDRVCGQGGDNVDGASFCDEHTNNLTQNRPEHDDYERLWSSGYGENGVIMQLDYPNKIDLAEGRTGSCIQIHGTTRMDRASLGCIKMSDRHVLRLCQNLHVDAIIRIFSSRANAVMESEQPRWRRQDPAIKRPPREPSRPRPGFMNDQGRRQMPSRSPRNRVAER
jgi:hypothetical protein